MGAAVQRFLADLRDVGRCAPALLTALDVHGQRAAVTRLAHLWAVVLALLVAWQPVAAALPDRMVCRYTGRVIEAGCPCPLQDAERRAELGRQSCCELRSAPEEAPPAEVRPAAMRVNAALTALPAAAGPCAEPVLDAAGPSPVPDACPPGGARLFVRLRHLLI